MAFGITQWVVVSVLLWIATAASLAAGTYCDTSTNIHFAHIWVCIIKNSHIYSKLIIPMSNVLLDYDYSNSFRHDGGHIDLDILSTDVERVETTGSS